MSSKRWNPYRLFVGVNVDALGVLDQLPLQRLGIVDFNDAGRNGEEFRKKRRAKASCSCNQFEAFRIRAHGDGLNESVMLDALGLLWR